MVVLAPGGSLGVTVRCFCGALVSGSTWFVCFLCWLVVVLGPSCGPGVFGHCGEGVCVFVCVWRFGPVGLVWASSGLLLAAQGRCFYGRSSVWRVVLSACPGLIGAGWLIAEASHRFGLWWGLGLLCVRWGQRGNIWIFSHIYYFPSSLTLSGRPLGLD